MTYHSSQPPYGVNGYAIYPPQAYPPPAPRRRRGRIILGIAAAAVLVAGATAGILMFGKDGGKPAAAAAAVPATAPATPATLTVSGDIALHDDDLLIYAGGCAGQGGYDDVADGAAVTLTDATGAIVGLGRLTGSQLNTSAGFSECDFSFVVTDVPPGKGFYGVEVSHRGSVKYAEADLASPIALTLGS